ncbi:MAG: enoyl-CoA hydratase/isomerase family protein [Sphingobacteriales bacterium]|jgi:methylglutaconyl-CoA hydratase|nr:enoyl-CoA hydratase/isomerase family protein [Sphingobacteriales bacterium]
MSNGSVQVNHNDGISTIVFQHPQSNSLPGTLLRELATAVEDAGNHAGSSVIVLKSEGEKAFCAGASFDELVSIDSIDKGTYFFSGFAGVINAMRKAPKFIIARVQGKAVGGGVGLAAAADYTLAHESASVKLSELAVGIGPFVVGPAVERKIGVSAFSQLTIAASDWKDAHWAREKGLYTELFPDLNALDQRVNALSKTLAASNPEAMMMLKRVMWEGTDHWDQLLAERAGMSGKLVLSEFTRNAIASFKSGAR